MWFDNDTAKTYPRCASLVRSFRDKLKNDKKINSAFLKACNASNQPNPKTAQKYAKEAIAWDDGPKVGVVKGMIVIRGAMMCGLQPQVAGVKADVVQITSVWMTAYEHCATNFDAIANARRVMATLLHECVHWVRQESGASDQIYLTNGGMIEAGEAFEQWAYGELICNPDELSDAKSSGF